MDRHLNTDTTIHVVWQTLRLARRSGCIPARDNEGMCRNIRPLHNFEPAATEEEVRAAALQYVRKISGMNKPSKVNEAAFNHAIEAVAHASMHLLADLETNAPPKDREVEAAKRRARAQQRYAA